MPDLFRFLIFRTQSLTAQQLQERLDLMELLPRLQKFLKLDDVEFGEDPPDFVILSTGKRIAVELTDLLPKRFGRGGYRRKRDLTTWRQEVDENPEPRHVFEWGKFTLKESLEAFSRQLDDKAHKIAGCKEMFWKKWLLMHVAGSSPFGELIAPKRDHTAGREVEAEDYLAKTAFSVSSICQRPHPFDYVILFSGPAFVSFPADESNPYNFPTISADVLQRGASASERFLNWRSNMGTFVERSPASREPH